MYADTGTKSTRPLTRLVQRGCAGLALAGAAVAISSGAATAADNQDTTANARVDAGITLTALTSAFTLTGTPGATVDSTSPVTYNVETNNVTGYAVTVQSSTATMDPAVANGDTIPIADLTVRETGSGAFSPVTATSGTAVVVHAQDTRSANGGDNLSTDFEMRIPTVNAGTYSATLNYLAASNL